MPNNSNIATPSSEPTTERSAGMDIGESALARRRLLLKSLSKGSTVIAAAVMPLHTLATTPSQSKTASGKRCSVSGNLSGVHSKETIVSVCAGKKQSTYADINKWPNCSGGTATITNGATSFNQNALFSAVFGTSSLGNKSLIYIMVNNASSDEAHWITALLNSQPKSSAQNFPYTPKEVVALFADTKKRPDALAFFSGYMETL